MRVTVCGAKPGLCGIAGIVVGLCVMLCTGSRARAETITFDDLATPPLPLPFTPVTAGYAGLTWQNFLVLNVPVYKSGYPNDGFDGADVSAPNVIFNGAGLDAAFSSPGDFTLQSLYLTAGHRNGLRVTVNGYQGGTLEDTTTVSIDSTGPSFLTLNWAGLDSVAFHATGGTNPGYQFDGTQFAIDNLRLQSAPVPEAGTLLGFGAMIAAAAGGLLLRKRRAAH